jgi:1-phosphofructokinase family hexose kinase
MAIYTVGFNPAIDRILECPDFTIGGHQAAREVIRLAAGKAANVSRALAPLGTDSIATGFVGAADSELFRSQLAALGPGKVSCRFVEVAGRTRENITILDPRRKQETHLRDRGCPVTAADARQLETQLLTAVKKDDVVVFSGSLCGGITPEYLERLIDRCTSAGARVALDSSGDPLRRAGEHKLWLIKPNLDELRALVGMEVPNAAMAVRDAAKALLEHVQLILVSRGLFGAVLITAQGSWSGKINSRQRAIRTVGCGDHLLAGFIAQIMHGADLEPALRFAMAVASARALSADPATFDPALVETSLGEIEIERI